MGTVNKIPYHSPNFVIQSIDKYGVSNCQFIAPNDILIDSDNNLFISEFGNCRIHKMTTTGTTISPNFIGLGNLSQPRGMTLSSEGKLFVCDVGNKRTQKFRISDGEFEGGFANIGTIQNHIQITPTEDKILLSGYTDTIEEYTSDGKFIGFIRLKNEIFYPTGLAFNSKDDLLIGESSVEPKIVLFDMRDREFVTSFKISKNQDLNWHRDIYLTIDSFDNIIVSNTSEGKIEIFDAGFEPISTLGSADFGLKCTFGVCVDENYGRIIFCDVLGDQLQIIQYLNFQ